MLKTLIILFVVIPSCSAVAQLRYGMLAGVNLSKIKSTLLETPTLGLGPHLGWYGEVPLADKLDVTGAVILSDKGFNNSGHEKVHFLYATLPVTLSYPVTKRLSVEAGAGAGYLIDVFAKGDDEYVSTIWSNRLDFEILCGISLQLSDRIGALIRYEYGLSNVIGKDAKISYRAIYPDDPLIGTRPTLREEGNKDYNRNIQFSVSYRFGTDGSAD